MASLLLGYGQKGGIADIEKGKPELVILMGADEVPAANFSRAFKVYIGHHGDKALRRPPGTSGATYAGGTYVSIEGGFSAASGGIPPGERARTGHFRALQMVDRCRSIASTSSQ
jgi:NADH-quinone oxidoreductase subunit G